MTAMQSGYQLQTKLLMMTLISQVLPCTATFKLGQACKQNKKIHIDLIMTSWRPMYNFQNKHKTKT